MFDDDDYLDTLDGLDLDRADTAPFDWLIDHAAPNHPDLEWDAVAALYHRHGVYNMTAEVLEVLARPDFGDRGDLSVYLGTDHPVHEARTELRNRAAQLEAGRTERPAPDGAAEDAEKADRHTEAVRTFAFENVPDERTVLAAIRRGRGTPAELWNDEDAATVAAWYSALDDTERAALPALSVGPALWAEMRSRLVERFGAVEADRRMAEHTEKARRVRKRDTATDFDYRVGKIADDLRVRQAAQERVRAEQLGDGADTWMPADLDAILADEYEAPRPTIMARDDGLCLIYPGLVHSFHGESESGKSFLIQWVCAGLVADGEDVLYVDYESDARSVVNRLRLMGAPDDQLRKHFTYVRPETRPDVLGSAWWETLLGREYSLAVIDGVTDSFVTFGFSILDNDEVAQWLRLLPRRIATDTGAGVVLIDHVTKSKEGRGRFAVGAQAKLAGLDGAAYLVDVETPLGVGRVGRLTLHIGKDRPGSIRGRLPVGEGTGGDRLEPVAEVVVDSRAVSTVEVLVKAPNPLLAGNAPSGETAAQRRKLAPLMEEMSRYVEARPSGVTKTPLRLAQQGKAASKTAALDALIQEGYLVAADGGDPRAQRVTLISARPYRKDDDPLLTDPLPRPLDEHLEEGEDTAGD